MFEKDKAYQLVLLSQRLSVSRTCVDSTLQTATRKVSTAERNMSVILTLAEAVIK